MIAAAQIPGRPRQMAFVHLELCGEVFRESALETAVDKPETRDPRQRWSRKIFGDVSAREYAVALAIGPSNGQTPLEIEVPQGLGRINRAAEQKGSRHHGRLTREYPKNGIGPAADLSSQRNDLAAPDCQVDGGH